MDQINPWAEWGLTLSLRDGQPALAETALWYLELRHPETIDRDGDETYLHLDRAYRVVRQGDRAWVALVPAPYREKKGQPGPGEGEGGASPASRR